MSPPDLTLTTVPFDSTPKAPPPSPPGAPGTWASLPFESLLPEFQPPLPPLPPAPYILPLPATSTTICAVEFQVPVLSAHF